MCVCVYVCMCVCVCVCNAEAKEDNQLSPGGPSNRRKLGSQPTKMNSFRSRPSWSLTPDPPACN